MAETLGQAVLEVGVDDSRLRAGLAGVEGQVRRTSSVIGELGGLIAGVGAITAFGGLINAASELESITRKLANTLGDQGAQQALGFTRELSDRLGLSFTVLSDSFAGFTAAASAANIPLQEQQGLFEAVSTSAQRLGLSNDAINGSLLALQQVAAKGTVQMEELRGQLGERLPTAFAATARGLGVSNKELIKLVESGQLTAEQFFPALTKGLTELNGAGPAGVPTAAQNFASLQNVLRNLQADFGKEFLPGVVGATQKLAEFLQGFSTSQRAADLSGAFGFDPTQAQQLVGQLDFVEKKFGVTREQSKNIVSDALKIISDSRGEFDPLLNSFGQLTLTGDEYAKVLGIIEERTKSFTAETRAAAKALQDKIALDRVEQAIANRQFLQRKAERSTIAPARQELRFAREALGLEGERLRALRQRQEIEKLQRTEREAREKFQELGGQAAVAKGSEKAIQADAALQAAGINVRTEIVKGADALRRAAKEGAESFLGAARSLEGAQRGFATAVAGNSEFASPFALRRSRATLEDRVLRNAQSGLIDVRSFRQFGASVSPDASDIGLGRVSLENLAKLDQATSQIVDAETGIQEAKQAIRDLNATMGTVNKALELVAQRESNLNILVPVGATRSIYLP
jgi:tape measure domain-containing protein